MNFKNFKVEDENDDDDNAEFTSASKFTFKLKINTPQQKFKDTTQSLGNFISKKLQSNDHAKNNENDDVFYFTTKNMNKISTAVTSTIQTTNGNNGNGLELQTLFEPKEVITVTPVEVQSPLNFDDIFELPSSIVDDEDFTKSISDNYHVTSSEISISEHKHQSNNETVTSIPVELLSVVEQTDNQSKTVSTLSSSNNDNEYTEKSDEFGVLETISFDQDLEEPPKITVFHSTSTSSTTPSSNTQITQKLTSKELQNLDIITRNNENDEIFYSTTANEPNQVSTVKTNSYNAEHPTESSLTTVTTTDVKVTNTGMPTGGLNSKTNNYGGNTNNVVTHHPTSVTSKSDLNAANFTDSKIGTWPELTSINLNEIMAKLFTVTDKLPPKVLTDENMAISNTALELTATPMEGNKESKKLQNILITTNKLYKETQVKDNTNGEEVTSNGSSVGLAEDHGKLPTPIKSKTTFKVTSKVENLPHILQNTHKMLNYFKLKGTTDENMISTQPVIATEEDILSKILETTHYPFIDNEFKITTDEDMILQELEKAIVSNFEVNTESSRVSELVTLDETDTTLEKLKNTLITKNNWQEETASSIGNVVSEELESTTFQTHMDENKDLLTSHITINDGTTITSSTLSKEHDNELTQIIGKTSQVSGEVKKTTGERFNEFMIKKTTNEDMVSNVPLLTTEIESLSQVLKTTHNPIIENKLKITSDENMYLQELEKTIVSNFELTTESSTVSTLVTLDETDTTAENIFMTQNNLHEGTHLNETSIGNGVSEELELSTFQTHIEENKDLLTSNEPLTSSEEASISKIFPTSGTVSKEHGNVLTQIIGKTSKVTAEVEKTTEDKFNEFMIKRTTNEDMVSNVPLLSTEILKTTHNPLIGNKLKITTDENMYLQELEKTIVSNFELTIELSTVSAEDTLAEKLENILTTKNNLQEGIQLNASSIGNVVSKELEFSTFQTHIDENKDLLTSNELLSSSETTSIDENFPSNQTIKVGTTITLAALSKEHDNMLTNIIGKNSKVTAEVEKTTGNRFNEFMLKRTTNEDMVSNVPLLATDIKSLSQVVETTHNPFIENNLKITTDENMILQELGKTITNNLELTTESSTVSALVTLDETDTTAENILMTQTNLQEFTTFQTHMGESKDVLTSNEPLTSSEATSIGDNFPSNQTKVGTTITIATFSKEHDNVPTEDVKKNTRNRYNEIMLKKTSNEDMVLSEPVLTTEAESLTPVVQPTQLKVTTDENMILQFAENKESSTTSPHVPQIIAATEISPVTIKLPEENRFHEFTYKNAETELAGVLTKIESENKVWPDLTTTVEIVPHILTKSTIGLSNEFQLKDTTANEDMASSETHSTTTLTNLPHMLKTTKDLSVASQLSETTDENMLSKEAELTTTMEGTASNLLVTAHNIHTSETKETTNTYVEGNKEPSVTLNKLSTLMEEITRSENVEHIATDETHFKENTDLISNELKLTEIASNAEENMNLAAKLKGEYTNTMEVLPHISKTTNSLLKYFLVEKTTDEDMILQGSEQSSFEENKELSTESEHTLQTTAFESLPNIVIATTNQSAENKVFPDLTTTVKISSHILTETTKNLFQEFPIEETTVNEDMTPIESHSTTTLTNLPHILETTSKLFEEITNEDMVSKETELTTLTRTMEEDNELLTSNVPVTSNTLDMFSKEPEVHSMVTNVEGNIESSTILNEVLTLSEKPTQSENRENIPTTTELTQNIHFEEIRTNLVYEQASEHISKTTYNIFKIFEPKGSTDEDENMAVIESSTLPQISKIAPNVFLENELKQTTNNEDMSSAEFEVSSSTISVVENESSNNIIVKTETLPISSSNIPNTSNLVTEPHEIIAPNTLISKATAEISDKITTNKITLYTHTIGFGSSVESLPHSTATIHTDLILSKFTDSVKALEPNTDNLSKATHDIDFSSIYSDRNLGLSDKTNAYTETTKDLSNLNKEQSSYETNSESSLLTSGTHFLERNHTSLHFEGLTTKSYGNENGDWVTWPEANSTSEKNTVSTLITKLTLSDLLTTESSNTNEMTEIFQDVIGLSTKSEESSQETSPTLPDELQLDFNQTPIEHSTNLSTIENSLTNYMSTVEAGETSHSFQTKDQYTSSSQNTMELKTNYNQMKETQLGGITSPNLILSTISVETYKPNINNQSKTTLNIDFGTTHSNNNLEPSAKAKEYLTSHETQSGTKGSSDLNKEQSTSTNYGMNSESLLLSTSNHLQEKNETSLGFEGLTTKSYGNENGDWVTWPEINSTSDKDTISTLLTKVTISDSLNTGSSKLNDETEIFQDAIALPTTSKESLSGTTLTLPDELQLGFSQSPIEDYTNFSQITTAENSFESTTTTLNIKDLTNNILITNMSPIGIENTLHAFNTKDLINDTDHLLHKTKFDKTTATNIMTEKSFGQITTHFGYKTLEAKSTNLEMNTKLNIGTVPVKSDSDQRESSISTINPLFSLTEGNINTNDQTEITKTFAFTHKSTLLTSPEGSDQTMSQNTEAHDKDIMHKTSQITDTYTSTFLKPTHVEHLSQSENLRTESGNALTLMISDEITQLNQASIGSTLANQNYQTVQHNTNLMRNSDESSETHTSTLVTSTENSVILNHNQTLQIESGNKLTSDLNLTSFPTEVFLATTLSTPNSDSKITENNFNSASHDINLEHTKNTNNPTVEIMPHLELLDEEFMHFSTIGKHITITGTFERTTPIIHTTSPEDELAISHTKHNFLNSESILAKQSEIIQNSHTTLGPDQGIVGNQITQSMNTENQPLQHSESGQTTVIAEHGISTNDLIHSINTENQPQTTENAHPELSESSHTVFSAEQGISHNELTYAVGTEIQTTTTINANSHLSESSDHTTVSAEYGISVHTEYQPLTTVNEHPHLSESGYTTVSAEHELSYNELTHSEHTENQPLTTLIEHPQLLQSAHTILSTEHGSSHNELTHSENQPLTTVNQHPHLSESGHTTVSADNGVSHSELMHSGHTEIQPLTTLNDHPHLSESDHTTLSGEYGLSYNESPHLEHTENRPHTTSNEHPHLSKSGHITVSADHGLLHSELTHLEHTENQPLTILNEHPYLSESGHSTLSVDHELSHNELSHSEHTEFQPLTTLNQHPHLSESGHTTLSADHELPHNELSHAEHTEFYPLTTLNEHPHLSESGHTTLSADHELSHNELSHSEHTDIEPQTTLNEHPHLSESGHTTLSADHEPSHNELTHSEHTEIQPLTTLNEYPHLSESDHTTLSGEHGLLHSELTHLEHTENQPLTILNEHPHLSESGHTTLSADHEPSHNEVTHSEHTEIQPLTTLNEYPHLSESDHTTLSGEHGLLHSELTHLEHTENQPLTILNEHPHLSESGHTTLSADHEPSHNEVTHSEHTEIQPLTTLNEYPHLSESDHTTLSADHELSHNELSHAEHTEFYPLTTLNEHPHLSESGHTTLSADHELSHNELSHSELTDIEQQTTLNEHPHLSESGHTTLSANHEPSHNELTHSEHTDIQPLTTLNEYPHLSESVHTTLSGEHGLLHSELTHLEHTENQPLTIMNEQPYLSESGHSTLSVDHELSHNELSHSEHTEFQPLTTLNQHAYLSESGHTTLSADHELSHNELSYAEHTEFYPLTTLSEHPHLSESGHTTLSADHEPSHNELTHSEHTDIQPLTTLNEYQHVSESVHTTLSGEHGLSHNELTHLKHTENQLLTILNEHPYLSESGHSTLSADYKLSQNELSNSEHIEFQPLTTLNQHPHLSESGHTTLSADQRLSLNELTYADHTEFHPLTTLNEHPHLSESGHPTLSADHGLSHNELTHSEHTENQPLTSLNEHPHLSESNHTTLSAEHKLSHNELTHAEHTESQPLTTLNEHSEILESSHTTLSSEHGLSTNELTYSINIHATFPAELEILENETSHLSTFTDQEALKSTEFTIFEDITKHLETNQFDHTTAVSMLEILDEELIQFPSKKFTENTTYHTGLSTLPEISQNIHTNSHADLGVTSSESPHLLNTATQLLLTDTTEHQITDNLHTSFSSTPIIHGSASIDFSQHNQTFHADLGVSSNELPHLTNTTTQLLSNINTEHQIPENMHTGSITSTTFIFHSTESGPVLTYTDQGVLNSTEFTVFEDITKHSATNQIDHTTDIPKLEILDEELIQLPSKPLTVNTTHHTVPSILSDNNQNTHTSFHTDLGITSSESLHLLNTATHILSSETTVHHVTDNLHTSFDSTPMIIHDLASNDISQNLHTTSHSDLSATQILSNETKDNQIPNNIDTSSVTTSTFIVHSTEGGPILPNTDQGVFNSTEFTVFENISNQNQIDHTTDIPKLEILDEELIQLPSKPLTGNTTYHTVSSILSDNNQNNLHTSFHTDLGITSSELPHLLNTATHLLSSESTVHQVTDNLHTSLGSTSIIIHGSSSNDIGQNVHTTSHTNLGISSNELPHLLNTATQLFSFETTVHQGADNLHTSFDSTPIIIHDSSSNDISQNIHTTFHEDLSISSSELPQLSNIATQILPIENTDNQIPNTNNNTDQGVLISTEFTVVENITKHSETNQSDHTTDIPKLEILDDELIHFPNKLSTDHRATSGNELSRRPSTITKPLTSLNIVPPSSDITFSSTLMVHNTDNETKSNTEKKFAHPTENLAKHSNHTTLISTLLITSHDLNTENQQISNNHSSLVSPSTPIIPGSTDKEFYNSTEFSVYEDLAKHSETTQINQTTVLPKLEVLDEEFIQIPNKSIPSTANINQITNHTNLTTLPVTSPEVISLPTITLFDQIFSNFVSNSTLNYTKLEEEDLTTERLKHTLSNQNLNFSSETFNEHFLGTENSNLATNTNLVTNTFSHKETDNQFLNTHSTLSEFQTLEFSHSTESFKENLKSFQEWLGQPSVNGTDQTTMFSNVNESTLSVKANSDMEVISTNDLKHVSTLTHSTVSYFPHITNEDSSHTSKHHLGTETNEPTIFTINGAKEHQSHSNPKNLNTTQQGLDQKETLLPVITTSTLVYSQNYHNEDSTTNKKLPHVSVSRGTMSSEISTLLPSITTTSTLAYSHNYFSKDLTVNKEFPHVSISREIISSGITTLPSLIINTETSIAKSKTSPNLSTTQSLVFHNISPSTELHNLKTDQVGNNKIDNNSSETSNLTFNNLKTTCKEFDTNSNESMWQWPEMKPENPISYGNSLTGDHAKITQADVTIANAKFEPADNEILFTSKPNLSTTALEHVSPNSVSPNLVTHVTHPKLQPDVNKNIPPVEIQTGKYNPAVGNTNLHQSNGTLQNPPIYINLPVYPVDSTYPLLLKFNEYYSSTTKSSVIVDDEATDRIINTEQFRTMKFEDFNAVTEFPSTSIAMEEPAISKLSHTNQIYSNSMQPTTALDKALKTDNIEHNQQSVELTTKSEVTNVGKVQDKLPNAPAENEHQNQQNAEQTTKSETVHMSSSEEKINQVISNGVTESLSLDSALGMTHIESISCTSSNKLNEGIGSEEINKTTESSVLNAHSQPVMIISEFPKFQEESTCNYTDYLSQNNCMCSMDNLIKDLRMKLVNNFLNFSIDNFTCPIFTHVEAGIFLGNDSVPQISKSRRDVWSDMYSIVVRREIVDYQNMDRTLNEQLELKNTENDIFATPGMKILIPCISSNNLSEGSTNYSWTFSDNLPLTEGKIQETEGTLTIDNVAPQDAGNYTCIAISNNANKSDEKRYEHHLSVVSIPSYRLQTTLLYNSTEKCQSGDADIISLYLPHSLEGLICGNYFKVCSIEVKNPKCLNATQYTSVNLTVIIEPINVIMPAINNSVCDVGCEMKIYTHVVLFIIKNLEAVLKLPVFFRLSYRQQKLMPTEVVIKKTRQKLGTEAPKLIITCPPGFGYYKKTHVCGTCGRNTFSRGDETFCSPCPAGQYQPMVGSKSCLICATPLQDPYCLRVMYSNTHKFRVLIGITATVLVVLIILLLCIKSMKKSSNSKGNSKFGRESYLKTKRQSKRRNRDPDIEMQDSQPLLECGRDSRIYKGYNRRPPEPPPPDFY